MASIVLVSISACTDGEYVPAVSVDFADHDIQFHLVGSDRIKDAKFYGDDYNLRYDEILEVFIVEGKGEVHFLDLIIQFSPDGILINGKDVDLGKEVSYSRVVFQDGTVLLGNVNIE